MRVLGVCDGHDSGACLFDNGTLTAAVSEERLTGLKRQPGFPYQSIQWCLDAAKLTPAQIDQVMIAEKSGRLAHRLLDPIYRKSNPNLSLNRWTNRLSASLQNRLAQSELLGDYERKFSKAILNSRLARLGFLTRPKTVDHHFAHALAAAGASGFSEALVVSMDAFGDGYSTTLWMWRNGTLNELEKIPFPNSPALLYGMATAYLGYVEGDEGKVSGLAAWGNPEPARTFFDSFFVQDGKSLSLISYPKFERLVEGLKGISPEDVAAGAQESIQSAVARFISRHMEKSGDTELCLAGGLFANVRLNQEVMKQSGARNVFVFPHMGDGGLCVGAALAAFDPVLSFTYDPFLGPEAGNPQTLACEESRYEQHPASEATFDLIADDLQAGHAVALVEGKMEFGPRALGHRSILFSAGETRFAEELGEALGRPKVMPFAPVVLERDWESITDTPMWSAFRSMAITADAKPGIEKKFPVAVHADGTMRIQVLPKGDESTMGRILQTCSKMENSAILINTSFNRHTEPICLDLKKGLELFSSLPIIGLVTGGIYLRKQTKGER